ncbi:MAG: transglycosylase domain-containing protein [Erysipelotrichaceae bacterium]|nr:transglycosylase domain-containing protein [Erysipelotrichaceae bacterium]
MRKKLVSLVVVLFLCCFTAFATIMGQGYLRYKREVAALPIKQAVEAYTKDPDYVSFDKIDEDFVKAVVSVEDKRYFSRKGYDFIALFRALYHNLLAGDLIEGGSTITEQIAKNLYLDGYVTGLEEKSAEIYIFFALENNYSKEELFALYTNMNYYGDGYWGIRQASKGYYDREPDDLSLAQAAILAGIPNAPAIYQLSDGYEDAKGRQAWVLKTMYNNGYISQSQWNEAFEEDVRPINKSLNDQ